jgi:curli biogenesis system outer membrane secretion channel CsgG
MKKYLLCLTIVFLAITNTSILAYTRGPVIGEKKRVAIADFTIRQNEVLKGLEAKEFARTSTEKIIDAFASVKRFIIMDRTAVARLQREKQIQMLGYEDAPVNADLKAVAKADIYCTGEVQNVSVAQKFDNQNKFLGYDGTVELQLKVYDLSTSTLIMSKVVKGGTEIGGGIFRLIPAYQDTPSKAVFKALNNVENRIKEAVEEAFPVEGKIVEIIERKENKECFLVSLGSNLGFKNGNRLMVIEVFQTKIDGVLFTRQKKIGEVKIKTVEADGIFSEAVPVGDGGQMLINKFESGYNLVLRSQK